MIAKLIMYSAPTNGFSMYTYWNDNYKTVLYLDLQFLRATTEVVQENNEDQLGNQVVTFESVVEKNSFNFLANSPVLSLLKALPLHSTKELYIIETGETYEIVNIAINDSPVNDKLLGTVTIEVQSTAQTSDNCDQNYTVISC